MRFSVAIAALAASASAAVLPRANGGSWTVSIDELEDGRLFPTFTLFTEAYPDGLRTSCALDPNSTPVYNRCDKAASSVEWDGKTLKISQTVEKPDPQTLFGEADFTLELSPYNNNVKQAHGVVPVQKAIA